MADDEKLRNITGWKPKYEKQNVKKIHLFFEKSGNGEVEVQVDNSSDGDQEDEGVDHIDFLK